MSSSAHQALELGGDPHPSSHSWIDLKRVLLSCVRPSEPKSPGGTEEYLTTVVEFLKGQKAPVSLSTLGTAVKKPAGKVKLGPFLKQHPEVFSVEGDKVKLLTK